MIRVLLSIRCFTLFNFNFLASEFAPLGLSVANDAVVVILVLRTANDWDGVAACIFVQFNTTRIDFIGVNPPRLVCGAFSLIFDSCAMARACCADGRMAIYSLSADSCVTRGD